MARVSSSPVGCYIYLLFAASPALLSFVPFAFGRALETGMIDEEPMRTYRPPWSSGFTVALVLASVALPHDSLAGFPPPENATAADMADPANWPSDPAYGFGPNGDGQWSDYSFLPPAASGVVRRPEESASGMSVDLAWRLSIGDPNIILAITDSGIAWDNEDLIERAVINFGELATHKPLSAANTACGGDGPIAGYDCNGDGVVTVADYSFVLALPEGDRNGNGVLDPGDLILAYSDGVDDDFNGYVDDISGWDFLKDDNDPYDDTRNGHGTTQATTSVASANNGIGSAGACPLCRYLPLRVGDSSAADAQDFGEAVVFAADSGAKIVQAALSTVDMTRFAQSALDYAYEKNVLVVASMGDESSRHHNVPATANHTLPVHAVRYDGLDVASSTSFLAFHPCSNFGGQNFLSASGLGCSSEATGALSGIAGLVFSAGIKYGTPLSPSEVTSIFFGTADDVDIAASRELGSPYRYSQRGFDQRFGYGRVNANRAVEAVRDGRIPPIVDIVGPQWFEVLYKDRLQTPVEIRGTISAKRANSYDYVIEWAPGVSPLDADFEAHTLTHEENIDPTISIGTDEPIGFLDVRNVSFDPPRDEDSQGGQNDHAMTLRIRALAHYGGTIGDVPGELRRVYYVHTDPDLASGFPIRLGDSGEASPKMADLDGDGVRELVVPTSGGLIHAFHVSKTGTVSMPGFPFAANLIDGLESPPRAESAPTYRGSPGYVSGAVDIGLGREGFVNAPAIADLDGDGTVEIVASSFAGTIYVVEANGVPRAGFPVRLPDVPSCERGPKAPMPTPACMNETSARARGAMASPVLVDLNGDGRLEIVQATFDGSVVALDADGLSLPGFPVELHFKDEGPEPVRSRILTTPAVVDLNADGVPDLVVGSNERVGPGGQFGALYAVDGRGSLAPEGPVLPGWPVTLISNTFSPLIAEGLPNSAAVGRFRGMSGWEPGVVAFGNSGVPFVLPAMPSKQASFGSAPTNLLPARLDPTNPTSTLHGLAASSMFGPLTMASQPDTMFPLLSLPSVGDIDQDGTPDVIASGGSFSLLAELKGGGKARGAHLLAAWSGKTGAMLPGSPFRLEDYSQFMNHAVADLNDDDYPEIITGTGGYLLHAYDGCGREPKGFPKFTGQWISATTAVGDLDGDEGLEIAVTTRSGWLYVWHTQGKSSGVIAWESAHHDNRNTGNVDVPLDQGVLLKAKEALTADRCLPPQIPDSLEGGGGFACGLSRRGPEGRAAFVFAAGLSIALFRRRKLGRRAALRSLW